MDDDVLPGAGWRRVPADLDDQGTGLEDIDRLEPRRGRAVPEISAEECIDLRTASNHRGAGEQETGVVGIEPDDAVDILSGKRTGERR